MSAVKYVQETPGGGDKSGDISVGALSPSESSERDDPDGRGQHEVVVRKSIIFPVKKKKGENIDAWSTILPKMTVLVVSSDRTFTVLISQMIVSLGAKPVVVTSPKQTQQILRHRLKYATEISIIVHQSEFVDTICSIDELQNETGPQSVFVAPPGTVESEAQQEDHAPHAAALAYQPWYDLASKVRHRSPNVNMEDDNSDTITPTRSGHNSQSASSMIVTVLVAITGDPDGSLSDLQVLQNTNNKQKLTESIAKWDSHLASVLASQVVLPIVTPFTRDTLAACLCAMKKDTSPPKPSTWILPEFSVLSVSEDKALRANLSNVLLKAGVGSISVDRSQLDAALALQSFDCVFVQETENEPSLTAKPWFDLRGISNSAVKSPIAKEVITYIQQELQGGTPILALVVDPSEEAKEELLQAGAVSVLPALCQERQLLKAITTAQRGVAPTKAGPSKNRNRNRVEKQEGEQVITSTDGNAKRGPIKPKRHKPSQGGREFEDSTNNLTGFRGRREAKRRGSWSRGWVSLISSDTMTCGVTRGATHHTPQDRMTILEDFIIKGNTFFGVFDGHGPLGETISSFVSHHITTCMLEDPDLVDDEGLPMAMERACKRTVDVMLDGSGGVDGSESGCTACFGVVTHSHVYVANVGDSRTCFVRQHRSCCGTSTSTGDITVDHSPTEPNEAARVQAAGALLMQLGPVLRVVHPDTSREGLRGLAMTRSFGDFWARPIGVIAEPTIHIHKLTADDRYILCASDGIWDMLSAKEVAASLPSSTDESNSGLLSKAISEIAESAVTRWKRGGMEADDISLVAVAL